MEKLTSENLYEILARLQAAGLEAMSNAIAQSLPRHYQLIE
jgi:hypothetical protein